MARASTRCRPDPPAQSRLAAALGVAMTALRPIRVALDVRMPPGQWGGVQQLAEGLARGLGAIDGDDEFLFMGYPDAGEWLDPLLGPGSRRIDVPVGFGRSRRRRAYDAIARKSSRVTMAVGAFGGMLG